MFGSGEFKERVSQTTLGLVRKVRGDGRAIGRAATEDEIRRAVEEALDIESERLETKFVNLVSHQLLAIFESEGAFVPFSRRMKIARELLDTVKTNL